ncbi:secretion system protein E [Geothermobacter hydrogeniphilus]|uniref:Secretion system protein E n=2 Tax=Geothermobacter hydrogeniphilus TaxID=1969733 RepID=A0A1X0YDZ9_9BACT|nr:secretion system protein E [Geothermobacter hydrogeniphilus]
MARYAGLFNGAPLPTALPGEEQGRCSPREVDSVRANRDEKVFRLLFVDDEEPVLKSLQRIFLDENYQIVTAASAEQALELLASQSFQLIISDHRMPGMSGADLLKEVKRQWPEIIRIMLTGHADVQSIMGAVNEGAVYKFITKPWNDEDLRLTVSLALQQYLLIQENRNLRLVTREQKEKLKKVTQLLGENHAFLGNLLVRAGLIEEADFQQALHDRRPDEFITETLARLGLASENRIFRTLQERLHLEGLDLREVSLSREVVCLLPRELCEKHCMLPIRLEGREMALALADPSDIYKLDDLSRMTGFKIRPIVARASEVRQQLLAVYGSVDERGVDFDGIPDLEPIDEVDIVIEDEDFDENVQELLNSSEVPPIIRIVNAIISEAIRYRASDIHIEPKTKYTVVRMRIDGMLHDKIRIPVDLHPATVSRVKILARLDISERRVPQDGRITVKSGTRMVDLRVSTMPSINGEKVVMRILDKSSSVKSLDELGLLDSDLKAIRGLTRKPQGIIIATGPTGSGKTTLLYSLLGEMLDRTRNFETIEDPVEYFLEEANQVHVREKTGLNFASVLRATLRQDPDVILVGEVRDLETADVAFKAALTGHMVLTTLHTNSSIASITRLIDIGIKPYLIGSALEGVIAQRLVRTLCPHCRRPGVPDPEVSEMLRISAQLFPDGIWTAEGCRRCNDTGYLGRTGIYEIFMMNDDYRHLVSEGCRESQLLEMARTNGFKTLLEDGLEKVRRGVTTLEELLRVVGPQVRHERTCENCRRVIDVKYLYCPYCGNFKHNVCMQCRMPLEDDWKICVSCGAERTLSPLPVKSQRKEKS